MKARHVAFTADGTKVISWPGGDGCMTVAGNLGGGTVKVRRKYGTQEIPFAGLDDPTGSTVWQFSLSAMDISIELDGATSPDVHVRFEAIRYH